MTWTSVNPATEEQLASHETISLPEAEQLLTKARRTQHVWRDLGAADRAALLRRLGDLIEDRAESLGALITEEMGKPKRQATAEVEKCALLARYYADNALDFLEDILLDTNHDTSYITYEPLGVILGIMPWNYPVWQAMRFAVPALAAGNAAVIKPAPNVAGTALSLQELFGQAGIPEGVYSTVLLENDVIEHVIERGLVDGVSLTGSVRAGRAVGALAGKAVIPSVLELGGSDPFIVLEDADREAAVQAALESRMNNAGQVCIAAKRIIVREEIADLFTERFIEKMNRLVVGDPRNDATDVGPLARRAFVDTLESQIKQAQAEGATVTWGPAPSEEKGFYARPALLTDVASDMTICQEEVFGPVAVLLTAEDDEHAVALANATDYGLGAAVFSADTARAETIARKLDAGVVAVNDLVRSDPRLPFGGVKRSGYGRELGREGLLAFVNVKAITVDKKHY